VSITSIKVVQPSSLAPGGTRSRSTSTVAKQRAGPPYPECQTRSGSAQQDAGVVPRMTRAITPRGSAEFAVRQSHALPTRKSLVMLRRSCSIFSRALAARTMAARSPRIVSRMARTVSGADAAISAANAWVQFEVNRS